MAEEKNHLKAAGPIDPSNGFPLWFEDQNGLRLELGINRDTLSPDPRTLAIGDLPTPGGELSFPDNFPDESFYFLAEAAPSVAGSNGARGRARVILALEAAFGGDGNPGEGLNVVFARIRVRMDGLNTGTQYTVTHPYGVIDREKLKADDKGRVFYTEDLGIVEGDPTAVLSSGKISHFLKWSSGAPNGYIGDGINSRTVTGSPSGNNFVRIEGEGISSDPLNPNVVETNLFTVQGRVAKRVGAWLDRATYAKLGSRKYLLNIQARSDAGKDLRLVATGVNTQIDIS